jgi:hypothetical protein
MAACEPVPPPPTHPAVTAAPTSTGQQPPSTPAATTTAPATPTATAAAAPDPEKARNLPASATFRDLVKAARIAAAKPGTGTCLLRGGQSGSPATLEAALETAAAELADPPDDLDALLTDGRKQAAFAPDGLRIFTADGHSDGSDYLDLVAFTAASRLLLRKLTPVLIATDKGLYLGLPNMYSDGRLLGAEDKEKLKKQRLPRAKAWVVTAEGDAPLSRVREALSLVADTKGTVVLASPRPTAAPPLARTSRYDHRVDDGQPYARSETLKSGSKKPIGQYDFQTVGKLGEKFDAAVASCASSGGGGAINVMMLIAPSGKVEEACAETDDTGDAEARKCVVEAAKKLAFPKPDKKGYVNFGTEALFVGKRSQALCDP